MSVGSLNFNSYYNITEGKVCRQFKQPTDNSKTRVNKNNKTVHEEYYDYIKGWINKIETKDSDFGRQWIVTLIDEEGQSLVLQIQYSSGYSQAFLKMLPNVDFNQEVMLIPKMNVVDGKKKATLFITQGGVAVKWYYTKDDPNGLPELIVRDGKGANRGKKEYDDSDIMEFLEAMVNDEIVPVLPSPEEIKRLAVGKAGQKSAPIDSQEKGEGEEETTDSTDKGYPKEWDEQPGKNKSSSGQKKIVPKSNGKSAPSKPAANPLGKPGANGKANSKKKDGKKPF